MWKPTLALAALFPLLCVAPAAAQEGGYAREGFYVGLAGTYALDDFDLGGVRSDQESLGQNSRFGYRFHPNASAEIEFEWLEGFTPEFVIFGEGDLEVWAFTGNAKAHLLTGRVQPFFEAGVGILQAETRFQESEDFTARFGGGIDLYLTPCDSAGPCPAISLDATYVLPTGAVEGLNYISFGWGFLLRF